MRQAAAPADTFLSLSPSNPEPLDGAATLSLTGRTVATAARRRFEHVGGISASLEVIRPEFARREKPNTTKGQGDNKRLQSQAEPSSVSSPRSIWATFTHQLRDAR